MKKLKLAFAACAVIFPVFAQANTAPEIVLSEHEEKLRAAYQNYLECSVPVEDPLDEDDYERLWRRDMHCLAKATENVTGIRKGTDLLVQITPITEKHGVVGVLADDERGEIPPLKSFAACVEAQTQQVSFETANATCMARQGISQERRVKWERMFQKYGPGMLD